MKDYEHQSKLASVQNIAWGLEVLMFAFEISGLQVLSRFSSPLVWKAFCDVWEGFPKGMN